MSSNFLIIFYGDETVVIDDIIKSSRQYLFNLYSRILNHEKDSRTTINFSQGKFVCMCKLFPLSIRLAKPKKINIPLVNASRSENLTGISQMEDWRSVFWPLFVCFGVSALVMPSLERLGLMDHSHSTARNRNRYWKRDWPKRKQWVLVHLLVSNQCEHFCITYQKPVFLVLFLVSFQALVPWSVNRP